MKSLLRLDVKALQAGLQTIDQQLDEATAQQQKYKAQIFMLRNQLRDIDYPRQLRLRSKPAIEIQSFARTETERQQANDYAGVLESFIGFQQLDVERRLEVLRDAQRYLFNYATSERQALRDVFREAVQSTCADDATRKRFLEVVYGM